ncbi:hypothetical protein [Bacillus timonensis]|uniref:hypothetical protein n=1 Tax=Bacillus timonensis TaxID=1033734 RepID=UPI0002880796|nr:hypothetical protein [Bacillus timonensis]
MAFIPFQGFMREQPQSPPPPYVPPKPFPSQYLVDCLYNYTNVWLVTGENFWFYPTYLQFGEVAGYRCTGTFWTFYGFDERLVQTVACNPIPTLY